MNNFSNFDLEIKAIKAFTSNGEEINDVIYISQSDHIYLTQVEFF